ncbi:MAG: Na+/H+ antiporter subunit E, partial [Bacteroidales bacterium]|nr:Na+/H+ antiporter subunit E [Bacteroidales bacterium]
MKIKNQLSLFIILIIIWVLLNNRFQLELIIIGFVLSLIISILFGRHIQIFNELKFTPKS